MHRSAQGRWLAGSAEPTLRHVPKCWWSMRRAAHRSGARRCAAVGGLSRTALDMVRDRCESAARRIERSGSHSRDRRASGTARRRWIALLAQMAEAATRLLQADRASIFLWDRPNHTLVGRPGLGRGRRRIADSGRPGVVGQVVHTGAAAPRQRAGRPEGDRPPGRSASWVSARARCCACRCAGGAASCSARSS